MQLVIMSYRKKYARLYYACLSALDVDVLKAAAREVLRHILSMQCVPPPLLPSVHDRLPSFEVCHALVELCCS
jgi:hypothetical protein